MIMIEMNKNKEHPGRGMAGVPTLKKGRIMHFKFKMVKYKTHRNLWTTPSH